MTFVRTLGALAIATSLAACGSSRAEPAGEPPPTTLEPLEGDGAEPPAPAPPLEEQPSRLVLVTIDGARWEDVLAGTDRAAEAPRRGQGVAAPTTAVLPNLHRFVRERGALFGGEGCTHDVRTAGRTHTSLPGYMEIFTGRAPASCLSNECPRTTTPTLLDDVRAKTSAGDVAVFSSWSVYARAAAKDPHAIVMSTGGSTGTAAKADDALDKLLAAGDAASAFPGYADYRPDAHTGKIALRYLEAAAPRLLVVGLGDADEYAHRGDFDGYWRALRAADDFLGELDETLARMGPAGRRTTVLVTTDHGRAKNLRDHGPAYAESARVWIAAYGGAIVRRGVDCASQPLRLAHVASAARAILGLDDPDDDPGPLATELLGGAP